MVAERKFIDLEDGPSLADVAKSVRDTAEPITLRESGRPVAVISPAFDLEFPLGRQVISDEDKKTFMALAGSLEGLIDDDFVEQNARRRQLNPRPSFEL